MDVGQAEYGDAVLLRFDDASILVDGAHPGDQTVKGDHAAFPDQLAALLEQAQPPYKVDLLIVTHAHLDHIGCLPYLVAHDLLQADWALVADPSLGWGRPLDQVPDFSSVDARVRQIAAAFREELPSPRTDDSVLAGLLADAADLESRYNEMLTSLQGQGTAIVRHGRDDPAQLLAAFDAIGLTVLGPSDEHLVACAEIINQGMQDLVELATGTLQEDERATPVDVFRRLAWADDLPDAAAGSRPGPAINLQSVVTTFEQGGIKLLLGGDMQWIEPQVDDQIVQDGVLALRARIKAGAPYGFVKLSHHGSDNAFSAQLLEELGATPVFGICAGERSTSHPNPEVLDVLNQRRDTIKWVRTDHNRSATVRFDQGQTEISVAQGNVNDPTPNTADLVRPATGPELATRIEGSARGPALEHAQFGGEEPSTVEVIARIPNVPTRVVLSVDVQPGAVAAHGSMPGHPSADAINVGAGRSLPPLVFVTNEKMLAANIGTGEADEAIVAIRAKGSVIVDDIPCGPGDAARAAAIVRQQLSQHQEIAGVVLLGGYDVVPSFVVDCLPPEVRRRLTPGQDADEFMVWSDDPYGDRDGDQIAEVPVSRIPDGKSAGLVRTALGATDQTRATPRCGVRNILRPFADVIYSDLPGPRDFLISAPTTYDDPAFMLDADLVYIMLHGDFDDSTRYWGEDPPEYPVAVTLANVAPRTGRIVFAGCCWGALIADKRASRAAPNSPVGQKPADASLALAILSAGALAFVGCTGSHYSPREAPYDSAGGPMHGAFWSHILQGSGPAESLFKAKRDYAMAMPHAATTPLTQAIEFKTLRQFTCLGLGW